jgi:enamine deaminase RidA (YjgF/YER057c/UK114 family)
MRRSSAISELESVSPAPLQRHQPINPAHSSLKQHQLVPLPFSPYIDCMVIKHLPLLALLLVASLPASAQYRKQIPLPPSQNSTGADLPIAAAVWAGDTLYVSGWLDPDMKTHTDSKSQTVGIIQDLEKLLISQKLTLGDIVMMRVYLHADPAKEGKGDFAGMMAGYSQFFGTKQQPNKPARTTLQVVLPAASRGALVEIDVVAARSK